MIYKHIYKHRSVTFALSFACFPLTIDDWSEHCHTLVAWIAHCPIKNQSTDTGKKTTYSFQEWDTCVKNILVLLF